MNWKDTVVFHCVTFMDLDKKRTKLKRFLVFQQDILLCLWLLYPLSSTWYLILITGTNEIYPTGL